MTPGRPSCHAFPDQQDHVVGAEGKVRRRVTRVDEVMEDATDATWLVPVRQDEVFVAALPELCVVCHRIGIAGALHPEGFKPAAGGVLAGGKGVGHRQIPSLFPQPGSLFHRGEHVPSRWL